jgi:ankyrin repeat protein
VNIVNEIGATPLSTAAAKGHVEVVTELLNRSVG